MEWPHLIDNSLKAHHLYRRDREYVVENGEIVIVDEFTGRLMTGRQWSDGLHQAVEAKERVRIKEENQTLATITLQNFFKLYKKLSGMTGTAMTEANEFWKVYKLDVVAIPTNRPLTRQSYPDVIYRTEREKFSSIIDEIREVHETGRPILVGTTSIEKSELISDMLKRYGIPHQVLNAKYHEREAEIVAQAGRKGAVTIATNMAGRGTDIILGGNPEFMAWADLKLLNDEDGRPLYPTRLEVPPDVWEEAVAKYEPEMKAEGREVAELGGLHIIGTERHETRRIDNQLRGRVRPPGRPRLVAVLPVARRRPDAEVRRRVGLGRPDPAGHGGGRGDREQDGHPPDRGGPEEGRGAQLRRPQEPARIRRGHGRAAQAGLLVPPAPARRHAGQGRDPRHDRRPDPRRRRPVPGRRLRPASFAEWAGQRLGVELDARDFKGSTFEDAVEEAADAGRGPGRRRDPRGHRGEPPVRRRARRVELAGPRRTGPTPATA